MIVKFNTKQGSFAFVKSISTEDKEIGFKVPNGTEPIKFVDKMTEEDWGDVVDSFLNIKVNFKDYLSDKSDNYGGSFTLTSATESGESLLESLEVYKVDREYDIDEDNPYLIDVMNKIKERTGNWLLVRYLS